MLESSPARLILMCVEGVSKLQQTPHTWRSILIHLQRFPNRRPASTSLYRQTYLKHWRSHVCALTHPTIRLLFFSSAYSSVSVRRQRSSFIRFTRWLNRWGLWANSRGFPWDRLHPTSTEGWRERKEALNLMGNNWISIRNTIKR